MCTTGGLSWPRRCSRAFRWPSFTTSSSIASSRGSRWERSRDSPMAKRKGMDRRQFVTTTGAAAAAAVLGPAIRSGERRGGEEGRSRGSPYHLKKKKDHAQESLY